MTVSELIDALSMVAQNTQVKAWDADSEEYENVTGIVWDDAGSYLLIETDSGGPEDER